MTFDWKMKFASFVVLLTALSTPSSIQGQSLTFTTLAGPEGGTGADDGTGNAARLTGPFGVATDNGGNVYVADELNHTIRKITPAGAVTTLAGVAGLAGSADGTGSVARFFRPQGVAVDGGGNVYVADQFNHTVRKITPAGVVTTVAGTAVMAGSADGTGSAARFNNPRGVALDGSANIYVADSNNSTVRKISPTGTVTTLAGLAGVFASADGTGSAARFSGTQGVATDGNGNVYVADAGNSTIRRITPSGIVTTLAGLAGSSGSADGTGSAARFRGPNGVTVDISGNVFVADRLNHTIRKIDPAGVVSTLAGLAAVPGSADGTAAAARFNFPSGVTTDSSGNVLVADTNSSAIRKITPAGVVSTLAGLGAPAGSNDGTGSAARFNSPFGLTTDSFGNVFIADTGSRTIRRITPAGVVTTVAGLADTTGSADGTGAAARFNNPRSVAVDAAGNLFVSDSNNHTIRKITPAGVVTTLAGLAGSSGSIDGTGSAARFNLPSGIGVDANGNVYVAETLNSTIRKITPAGVVTTLAGLAGFQGSSDGTGSAARFSSPFAVTADSSGNVFVADSGNNTIRRITPAGVVTTLAGLAGTPGSADGTGSGARFFSPFGVATDSSGNVFVADVNNHAIRKITPAGVVTTVGGLPGVRGSADGSGSASRFTSPFGVAAGSGGNIFVAETGNNKIRVGSAALGEVATIDVSAGPTGTARQLSTSSQSASSWQWSVIRRPVDSVANLSSTTIRNPTFTPDVPGLYTFRLVATGASETSITLVSFEASAAVVTLPTPVGTPVVVQSGNVKVLFFAVATSGQTSITAIIPETAGMLPSNFVARSAHEISSTAIYSPPEDVCFLEAGVTDLKAFLKLRVFHGENGVLVDRTISRDFATKTVCARVSSLSPFVLAQGPGIRGDANLDDSISVADVFFLINQLFANGPGSSGDADANSDGSVSVADVFYLINFLFTAGPQPLSTGPELAGVGNAGQAAFWLPRR